nr:YbaY family lipoprotein [Azomonas macrocytogenes]
MLASCSSAPTDPEIPPLAPSAPAAYDPRSPNMRALSGSLIGAPAGAEIELALLEVNEREKPERLLSNTRLKSLGKELPFLLHFNPEIFNASRRVELRGRVIQSGQLIMQLPPRTIGSAINQSLGQLQLVPAP